MAESLDVVVVGAGVVGLAVARALVLAGREVVVLESEPQIGTHSSSRNSEVIHAGIYYPECSLKARLCVRGKHMLYRYCAEHGVAANRIGKLIVATREEDLTKLDEIMRRGTFNGVDDLKYLSADAVCDLEPYIRCLGAILSPSTGIVDSHGYMLALQGDIESHGGTVVMKSQVSNLRLNDNGFTFALGDERFACRTLINSAGLWAQDLVADLEQAAALSPALHYAKGHYFAYSGSLPFKHLVYPLPAAGGLGIHATIDLAGKVRFGPDVSWIKEIDYAFDENRKSDFVRSITNYFPDLDVGKLLPAYTGIRPKLHGAHEPAADFLIQCEKSHGIQGLVNLFGIESPGLTASLAIAEFVEDLLLDIRLESQI